MAIGFILAFSTLIAVVLFGGNIARPVLAYSSPVSLEGISDQGTFKVQLQWNTSAIGNVNQFNITFRDNSTGTVIEDVHYDWRVSAESGPPASVVKPDQNS